jgi:DNA-binding NarL/FixJ family response regulator
MLRILLADDNASMRLAIRRLLESHEDWEVCGDAADGREAIEKSEELHPDVIVMDLEMPNVGGLEATRRISKSSAPPHILILTNHNIPQLAEVARRAGAEGYVLKSDSTLQLIAAVDSVRNSKSFFAVIDSIGNASAGSLG